VYFSQWFPNIAFYPIESEKMFMLLCSKIMNMWLEMMLGFFNVGCGLVGFYII
jgi:hypothetical protein